MFLYDMNQGCILPNINFIAEISTKAFPVLFCA